jgi:hypothetical protein
MKKKTLFFLPLFPVLFFLFLLTSQEENTLTQNGGGEWTGEYTETLPNPPSDLKGIGEFSDEIVKTSFQVAMKYRLLPSVILTQWAIESAYGNSNVAKVDTNYFGLTWFEGCRFEKGSPRGKNGLEGGWYMKFKSPAQCFNYYGYMIASQANFNEAVGKETVEEVYTVLDKGGYASSGLGVGSQYYKNARSIIDKYDLINRYDKKCISLWSSVTITGGIGGLQELDKVLGKTVNNGECYGMTSYYVESLGFPTLMGSGFENAWSIGADYDWAKYGWQVIFTPKYEELKAGDVVNWYMGGIATSSYGHTGVIASVGINGAFRTYEQNAEKGRIVALYDRSMNSGVISSIIRKGKN